MILKYVVLLEKNYDTQDKFKGVKNCQNNSSSMQYEAINLSIDQNMYIIDLETLCTPTNRGINFPIQRI